MKQSVIPLVTAMVLMGFFWGVYVPYYAPSEPGYYTEAP